MPASWRRGEYDQVDYVVVKRDNGKRNEQGVGSGMERPTATIRRTRRSTPVRRQTPNELGDHHSDSDSDWEDEIEDALANEGPTLTNRPFTIPSATPSLSMPTTLSQPQPVPGLPANKGPTESVVVSLQPASGSNSESSGDGRISQTTEHLLIAAGSIGATIIIVMIILALYHMRKRGLTLSDVIRDSKNTIRRRAGPPPPPKYGMEKKQSYDGDWMYAGNDVYAPVRAATNSRSGSLSTQKPLQALGRSDSFNQAIPERKDSTHKSFILDAAPSRQASHRRDLSATPSSPILPIQDTRRSASSRNTRSAIGDEEALSYSDDPPRQQSALPAPPTFRQFLSNRPSISQRPGLGGAMMSRFSWTNSNAPQTPHDPSRDTVNQPVVGRDSFMTTRSSVPRFRTIDSWVNQQSTRVEEQRLKQQFRMTQSTTYSDDDNVPEMPAVPKDLKPASSGLAGKNIKHQRHDTVDTAPIFKAHPGTEVRFSTRSTVPSEVLDMGRRNVAL